MTSKGMDEMESEFYLDFLHVHNSAEFDKKNRRTDVPK